MEVRYQILNASSREIRTFTCLFFSFYLWTVQVCSQHYNRVRQNIGSVSTSK